MQSSQRRSQLLEEKPEIMVVLNAGHVHHRGAKLIRSETGNLICSMCMDYDRIKRLDDISYLETIQRFLDILFEHSKRDDIRNFFIPFLEFLLLERPVNITRDDIFFDILRSIHNLINSDRFNLFEFSTLANVLSKIGILQIKPVPLQSAWKLWGDMLNYGEKELIKNSPPDQLLRIMRGLFVSVRTYLSLLNRNQIDLIAEIIFPLFVDESPEMLGRKCRLESEARCLTLIMDEIAPRLPDFIFEPKALRDDEILTISEFFGALSECLEAARHRKNQVFIDWLVAMNFICKIRIIFQNNVQIKASHRESIMKFLKDYTFHFIEEYYGSDESLKELRVSEYEPYISIDKVERENGNDQATINGKIFFLLVSCVAAKQDSRFYSVTRIRVILAGYKNEAIRDKISTSKVLLRVFAYMASLSLQANESKNFFVTKMLNEMAIGSRHMDFRDIFCYETEVFAWGLSMPIFLQLIDKDAIDHYINRSCESGEYKDCLKVLINRSMKRHLRRYLEDGGDDSFRKLVMKSESDINTQLAAELSLFLSSVISGCMTSMSPYLNHDSELLNAERDLLFTVRIMELVNLLSMKFQSFEPLIDRQFIRDFVGLISTLYSVLLTPKQDVYYARRVKLSTQGIPIINDFVVNLMKTNNIGLIELLAHMNYEVIGQMYYYLLSRKAQDECVSSTARVFLAYNDIDYPFEYRIEHILYQMGNKALEWMFTNEEILHQLSFKVIKEILAPQERILLPHEEISGKTRYCMATMILNMIVANPKLIEKYKATLVPILQTEEFKNHPYLDIMLSNDVNMKLILGIDYGEKLVDDCNSDDDVESQMSFESVEDLTFEDEQLIVSRILDSALNDIDMRGCEESSFRIPGFLYLSKAIRDDEPSEFVSTQDWEKRAYEASQTVSENTQSTR